MLDFQTLKIALETIARRTLPQSSPEWFPTLMEGIDQFWEGVPPEEKAELLEAWNTTREKAYDESHLFDWIDDENWHNP